MAETCIRSVRATPALLRWLGYNTSLFAYGQTGSGKSYSMVGYGVNRGQPRPGAIGHCCCSHGSRQALCPSRARRCSAASAQSTATPTFASRFALGRGEGGGRRGGGLLAPLGLVSAAVADRCLPAGHALHAGDLQRAGGGRGHFSRHRDTGFPSPPQMPTPAALPFPRFATFSWQRRGKAGSRCARTPSWAALW